MPSASKAAFQIVREIFDRVASDLSMLADRDIDVGNITYEERTDRPAGAGTVHIAYRFGVMTGGDEVQHGAMLIPLEESIALAGYLMMASDSQVAAMRESGEVDHAVKEAILEVGNFVAAASDSAMRSVGARCERVVFEGCQGVRADVRPALQYEEGDTLGVGRAQVTVAGTGAELALIIPHGSYLGS